MKILITGFTKLAYMPYMNFYLKNLISDDNDIHIVYWNRDCKGDIELDENIILHEFKLYQEDEVPKIKKIGSFIKYRKFVRQLVYREKYDKIIILHTLPGVLLFDLLISSYKNKYILDYRDFTFENIKIYKKIISILVKNSTATFISSPGFRKYLPNSDKIYLSHNILIDSLNNRPKTKLFNDSKKVIKLSFWGFIRHEKINRKIIEGLSNDKRFELHYYGREQATAIALKEMCKKNNINNVFFHGKYQPNDRYEFAKNTDILHNLYDNDETMINAMANKYYDGIIFYIPQLCTKGSTMGMKIKTSDIGYEINPYEENFADKIYKYYESIDWDKFTKKCDEQLEVIMDEYKAGINIINKFVK